LFKSEDSDHLPSSRFVVLIFNKYRCEDCEILHTRHTRLTSWTCSSRIKSHFVLCGVVLKILFIITIQWRSIVAWIILFLSASLREHYTRVPKPACRIRLSTAGLSLLAHSSPWSCPNAQSAQALKADISE